MNIEQLKQKAQEYLATLDDTVACDYYLTDREFDVEGIRNFLDFLEGAQNVPIDDFDPEQFDFEEEEF